MTGWRRGSAAGALFVSGASALVVGTALSVLNALQILGTFLAVAWVAFWSRVSLWGAAPNPKPLPDIDVLQPSILFVAGVMFVLVGWVILIQAVTLAWPDRRDRAARTDGLAEDTEIF